MNVGLSGCGSGLYCLAGFGHVAPFSSIRPNLQQSHAERISVIF